ncbi:hypothetical protein [Mariniblastus fucicola]|uniref:DUF883 domain-containing protein n=1 Tax=Mariniblastus fucicola TaxID=980251 RepID=A0A5B9P716_9BACT|nr:hypothetical protein [Mariniblastus fucicola]QEG20376.1 hypothetical protein MFFC18_02240 [Mariniblastus fucicola]
MIARYQNRFSDDDRRVGDDQRESDQDNSQLQLGSEILSKVRDYAAAKPMTIVAAGLAIGIVSGLILKRK